MLRNLPAPRTLPLCDLEPVTSPVWVALSVKGRWEAGLLFSTPNQWSESWGRDQLGPLVHVRVESPGAPLPFSSPSTPGSPAPKSWCGSKAGGRESQGANAASLRSVHCYWPKMISPPPGLCTPDWPVRGCCAPQPAGPSFRRAPSVCVRLGERRGEAPGISQETRKAGAWRPLVRVSTPSHQPVPSNPPLAPFGIPTPSKAILQMMLRREAGSRSSPPPPSV
jgi:hypothetical protein